MRHHESHEAPREKLGQALTRPGRVQPGEHTHFSDSGAMKIAGLIVQALQDQNLALADYLL